MEGVPESGAQGSACGVAAPVPSARVSVGARGLCRCSVGAFSIDVISARRLTASVFRTLKPHKRV